MNYWERTYGEQYEVNGTDTSIGMMPEQRSSSLWHSARHTSGDDALTDWAINQLKLVNSILEQIYEVGISVYEQAVLLRSLQLSEAVCK